MELNINSQILQTVFANEYARAFLAMVGTFLAAHLAHFIVKYVFERIARKTKNEIDDIIVHIIAKPLYVFIVIGGTYLTLNTLSFFETHTLFLKRVFFTATVLIITFIVSTLLAAFVTRWIKVSKGHERTPQLITKIITIAIYLSAILIIMAYYKIEITPFIATLGVGGLAVGLALQNTLSNLFAGVHLVSDKPIGIGDFIEIEKGTIAGYVEDIGWRSTRIRTLYNTIVIVPNAKLAASVIINNFMPERAMSIWVQCGIAYGSDLEKVERVTCEVAREIQKNIPGAVKTFEPFVRFHGFGDSNINFYTVLRIEEFEARYRVIHEFIKALKSRYNKEAIEISWPIRKIYYGNKAS